MHRKAVACFWVLASLILGMFFTAGAAEAVGTLTGKVTDSVSRAALPGALVTATGTPGTFSGTSGTDGIYTISLPGGTYTVTCAKAGYKTFTKTGVIITEAKTTTLNIALVSTNGTLTGTVTISGTRTYIAGATVTAVGTPGTYSGTTNSKGLYTISLPAATYTVTCAAAGYNTATASPTIKTATKTTLNFALTKTTVTTGTLGGTVTNAATGAAVAGAAIATNTGGYSATTGSDGKYSIAGVTAGTYNVTCTATGMTAQTKSATITAGLTTTLNFALASSSASIISLAATPGSFVERGATAVTLAATISGTPASYAWSQTAGPKVPLAAASATSAAADVFSLSVAAESTMTFRLTLTSADGASSYKEVSVFVQPADIVPVLGPYVEIGGSTTAVARFTYGGAAWTAFNVGSVIKFTPVGLTKGTVYSVVLPGFIYDIDIASYGGKVYALASCGPSGIGVVDITNPAAPLLVRTVAVNYFQSGVTFCDTGGTIATMDIQSTTAPIDAVETDGTNLWIADFGFGIHKTALSNLIGGVLEADGTLRIDAEKYTLQYAGEGPWGGPISLKLVGTRLYASLGALGLNIYDAASLNWLGRYNLYTDAARLEDYFGPMDIAAAVGSDAFGDLYLDDFTGMPDYRQVQYEILVIMKGTGGGATPWADFVRNGYWYYKAQDAAVATFGSTTIAYAAYSLGGVVAVDVTNPAAPTFLGYFPAVPVNGPYETNSLPASILTYEGAGMLKESGITGVKADVAGNKVLATDHFAGLVILDKASTPNLDWRGPTPPYNNNTDGIANNNVPDYEDITSYDMSPWDPLDNESLPWAFYQAPCQLATKELYGHGNNLALNEPVALTTTGNIDVLECSGAGGFVFVDVTSLTAANMADRFAVPVYFPTTDEIGALPDGTAGQTIALGHASGVDASERYLYVSDGPHGVIAFNLTDPLGYPTDAVHVVANTLQDEYPVVVGTETIYPASHTVRNVVDVTSGQTWAQCVSNGMRAVPIDVVESGNFTAPLLLKVARSDIFEHNADDFVVKAFPYQDKAYDVEFRGNYAYVADGTNGITVYDVTKNPGVKTSGFYVANVGYNVGDPQLGTASGIELWQNPVDGRIYAVVAAGPDGVGVVDVTDFAAMKIVKVFEPIKLENGDVAAADGQCIDVKVVGDKAYLTYDSFGVVCYSMTDLIAPVPVGVDPTNIFLVALDGAVVYDYRPAALGRFALDETPGYETVSGGAMRMDYTQQNGNLFFYVGYAEAGLIKIDFTNSAAPALASRTDTAATASDVVISGGRVYVADGSGGLVYFK